MKLALGVEAVRLLLPHRPPLALVDSVDSYERTPQPNLVASRTISSDEAVFAGHFPSQPIWPGCYTLEGLAQACGLLAALSAIDAAGALDAFLAGRSPPLGAPRAVLLASADVRFVQPVAPGCRLDYLASEERHVGRLRRYLVEARVGLEVVARGSLMVAA
jgi:3-hydroxyacyl-[acyl-carrier-protein] dehydratase